MKNVYLAFLMSFAFLSTLCHASHVQASPVASDNAPARTITPREWRDRSSANAQNTPVIRSAVLAQLVRENQRQPNNTVNRVRQPGNEIGRFAYAGQNPLVLRHHGLSHWVQRLFGG